MKEQRFRLHFLAYLVTIAAWIIPIWVIIFLMNDSTGKLESTKSLLSLVLIYVALMSPSLIVTWIFIVELTTSFSAHGIYRLTPFGMKQIVWREIETLKVGIFFLDILTFKKIYRIPLLMYQDAHALVNHVQEKYLIDSNGIDKMM